MIIDQLFEDDGKKKKLNEIDPRNYDSDEDYYNDLHGEDDDEDFDPDADDEDFDDEEPESHYEKHVRVNNLESRLNEFDMPVGQGTGTTAQTDTPPNRSFGVMIKGKLPPGPGGATAEDIWETLELILPRDYPRVPFQQQTPNAPQVRVLDDLRADGFSIVKQGINSEDIAATIASKFKKYRIPAEVIDGGLYEAYDPAQASKFISAATKAAKIMFNFERGYNQQFRSELSNQYGFDPDTPGIEVSPHNATELIKWLNSKGCKLSFNKKEPIEFSLSMPDQAQPYTFNILDMIQGGELEEDAMAPMPEFYAGQEITWRPKFAKMVPVPVTVVAAAPGKLKIKLQSPRLIQTYGKEVIVVNVADSDIMPKQGVAEAKAATASFRAGNKKRAELNAMSDEERRAYDKEQQEKQRKKDDAKLEKDRQKNAAKKGVSESRQRKLNEAMLLEDPVYRKFKRIGGYIAERKMTEKEILDVFADAETGMTNKGTGANRTFLGKGKDATVDFAKDVKGAVSGVLDSIQNSVPVSAVDVAYDQATDALANIAGGQQGPVMNAIKKYRNLAKQYPKTAGFAKAALVAIAGMATGGASLPVIAGLTYALDSAVKGDKLSSVIGKGAGAAALSAAAQGIHGGATQTGTADTNAFTNVDNMGDHTGEYVNMPDATDAVTPSAPNLASYTVKPGDTLSQIAADNGTSVQELVGLNPHLAAGTGASAGQGMNPDVIFPGDQITLPPSTGADVYAGGVGTNANTMADIAKGQVPDSAISQGMAAKGQATADASTATPDTSSAASSPSIDYAKPGPVATDSLGQKLEYGIPVNDQGGFIPPNPNLPAEELAKQTAAYDAWKADFMKRWPNATQAADGSMQGVKPGLNTMQIFQKPTLPAETGLTPAQQASVDYSQSIANPPAGYESGVAYDQDGNLMPGWNLKNINGKDWYTTNESIKFKKLPVDKLIDQKSTVLNWALSESVGRKSHSVNLTTIGTYTVFENVDRYRKAILEARLPSTGVGPGRGQLPDQYRPDMPGGAGVQSEPGMIGKGLNWLDKAAGKVGGAISNFGHQFTTGVTKEKLKMNWHQAGKPSDSDQLAAWLVKQGVPQDVVTTIYGKMGIPYTAPASAETPQAAQAATPAATGGAQKQMAFYGTNPATKKPWTYDELQAKARAGQTVPAADPAVTAAQPTTSASTAAPAGGPGFNATNVMSLPGMEKYAKKPAAPTKPNFAQQGSGYAQVNQPTSVKYTTPGTAKPAAPATAPTGTRVVSGGPTPDEQAKLAQRIAQAAKQPVAEMLSMVETKEDVQRIKQFIDQTFVKYGAVSESAFVVRNKLIEHVTQVGAQRRREYARKS